jgi:phosphoribosylformylglycinamidine cyclo-ligase
MTIDRTKLSYASSGVDEPREQAALGRVLHHLRATYNNRTGLGRPRLESGGFANVLDLGAGMGLAITTDGVGTKILLSRTPSEWESVAVDCIANNVNDLLCIGAEPIALVDYIALDVIDQDLLEALARGLRVGADLAHISVPGGEIAQVGDMLAREEGHAVFDLIGSAVGLVATDDSRTDLPSILTGESISPGDVILGLPSSGLHSNGFSLARKALSGTARLNLDEPHDRLAGRTLRAALLEPTTIYVDAVLPLLRKRGLIHGVANISGGGLLSLGRLSDTLSFEIVSLPQIPELFRIIQEAGDLSNEDMYATFNMGVGMVIVCSANSAQEISAHLVGLGVTPVQLGSVVQDNVAPGSIRLNPARLLGVGEVFRSM